MLTVKQMDRNGNHQARIEAIKEWLVVNVTAETVKCATDEQYMEWRHMLQHEPMIGRMWRHFMGLSKANKLATINHMLCCNTHINAA